MLHDRTRQERRPLEHSAREHPPPAGRQATIPMSGDAVELRLGTTVRTGTVETVMPNGTGFWIAAHGIDTRLYIHVDEHGPQLRILPSDRSRTAAQP